MKDDIYSLLSKMFIMYAKTQPLPKTAKEEARIIFTVGNEILKGLGDDCVDKERKQEIVIDFVNRMLKIRKIKERL